VKATSTSNFLLSAVGLLAALLAALATVNGGIDRIERNDRWVLFGGAVCVLAPSPSARCIQPRWPRRPARAVTGTGARGGADC
jgi:predicted cobalt transporter CbtA